MEWEWVILPLGVLGGLAGCFGAVMFVFSVVDYIIERLREREET